MPVVLKSGNLNFLESPGPVQACTRTAFYSVVKKVTENDTESTNCNKIPLTCAILRVFKGAMRRKTKDLSETLHSNQQVSVDLKYFNRGRGNGEYVYGVAICKKKKILLSSDITSPL